MKNPLDKKVERYFVLSVVATMVLIARVYVLLIFGV